MSSQGQSLLIRRGCLYLKVKDDLLTESSSRSFIFVIGLLITVSASLGWLSSSHAQGGVYVEDMSRGLRFEPPLTTFIFFEKQENHLLIGNHRGRVYQSDDGGESWLESSALTPRQHFIGSSISHRSAPFSPISILDEGILPSPGQLFSFDNLIDLNRPLPQVGGMIRGFFDEDVSGDPEVSGFMDLAESDRASWRLASAVSKKLTIGLSWRALTESKTSSHVEINYLTSPAGHPNVIFAATNDGLLRSGDGGDSWPVVYSGVSASDRKINVVEVNPHRPQEVWVGSENGLRVSHNGGETFQIPENRFVNYGNIQRIVFHPTEPDTFYVGLDWAMLTTQDRGVTFEITYYEGYPPLGFVRRIFIDPYKPERIVLGTYDGLMMSTDGGETFKRSGGLLFLGEEIVDIKQGFRPGHYIAATQQDLWESFDGGQSWQVVYFGSVDWDIQMVRARMVNREPELWILTSAELLKLAYRAPPAISSDLYRLLRDQLAQEPSMSEAVDTALRNAGVHQEERLKLKQRARWSALLPQLEAFYVQRNAPIDFTFTLSNFFIGTEEAVNTNEGSFNYGMWGAFASWDLLALIAHPREAKLGRGASRAEELSVSLRELIIRLYQERIMLIASLSFSPKDERTTLMRYLRLEELTAHLNLLAGDLFVPFNALEQLKRLQ